MEGQQSLEHEGHVLRDLTETVDVGERLYEAFSKVQGT
jgi:hypothetical protein